ncbi:MAG: PIN domain-containing protein [Acidobacteriota bacterium]|nr:PIN domain-containing protein [Acidobacteriota bacterium]
MDSEAAHAGVRSVVEDDHAPHVVSPYVLAELDYMLARWWGMDAASAAVEEMGSGAWELAQFDAADLRLTHRVMDRHRDQPIGLTDASLVVLAERYRTNRLLTLDHRHFGVLRTTGGEPFELLPG